MATTPQDVFDLAMGIMDEISSGGSSDTSDTTEYKNRTLRILNVLRLELYPLSDTYTIVTAGKRPVCAKLVALADEIDLDDYIAQAVMPYGLGAELLKDENPTSASYLLSRYQDLKAAAKNLPAVPEAIEDVYGGIEHGEYSVWS